MSVRTPLGIGTRAEPFTLCVEPWAEEFVMRPGESCRVVAIHPFADCEFIVDEGEQYPGTFRVTVTVNTGGATYEFWRGERLEFETPVPIPGHPHWSEPV